MYYIYHLIVIYIILYELLISCNKCIELNICSSVNYSYKTNFYLDFSFNIIDTTKSKKLKKWKFLIPFSIKPRSYQFTINLYILLYKLKDLRT